MKTSATIFAGLGITCLWLTFVVLMADSLLVFCLAGGASLCLLWAIILAMESSGKGG